MPDAHDHERLHASDAVAMVAEAMALLHARGGRVTTGRRAILAALAGNHDHVSADRIASLVEDAGVHRATVYRTLDALTDAGIVTTRALPGGGTGYHLAVGAHGHLHGVCRVCGRVVALAPDCLDDAAELVRTTSGFRLQPAHSSLAGLCADCARG